MFDRYRKVPQLTVILIGINVAIYLLVMFLPSSMTSLYNAGTLSTVALSQGRIWTLVTSMFLHGSLTHLLCNMISRQRQVRDPLFRKRHHRRTRLLRRQHVSGRPDRSGRGIGGNLWVVRSIWLPIATRKQIQPGVCRQTGQCRYYFFLRDASSKHRIRAHVSRHCQ